MTLPNAAGVPSLELPANIVKRDGRVVPFDLNRIENAVQKCFVSIGSAPGVPVPELSRQVGNIVAARWSEPTVEQVQDNTGFELVHKPGIGATERPSESELDFLRKLDPARLYTA